jgi:poly(3-hydroxyalkanoate) synthetase
MVNYLREQGFTVFMISWLNPDETCRMVHFEDYMTKGPLEACSIIRDITGEEQVSAIGYCLAGILLATTAAWANSAGESPFASITCLASSMDFRDPGDMGIFVDEQLVKIKDHIARWRSCYAATQLQGNSENRFVLAGSGHIAGVINPPIANKYYHYTNPVNPPTCEEWLDSAFKVEGSWWADWVHWQLQFTGDYVPAREIDAQRIIEPAPGSFVRRRLDDVVDGRQQAA